MDQVIGPWLVAGGYAVGLGLLLLGSRFDGQRPTAAAICYTASGVALSETSLYWLSAGTRSDVPGVLWVAFPLVIAGLATWRAYRQRTWTRRLGGGRPSFGVLPSRGIAVSHDSRAADAVAASVELDHGGHRLLGLEYGLGGPSREPGFPELTKAASTADGTYAMVQLRTPTVPTLVITPNVGAFEPERFTPLEDVRITRNTIGSLKPDAQLVRFEAGAEFDKRFTVTTSDPDFAAAVLTPEVRELLAGDLWFRVREVVFHGGSLWTTEAGALTEERLFTNGRRLALLAAAVRWDDDTFAADISETDWVGKRGVMAAVRAPLNRRREAADRQPLSSPSLLARSVVALALLLPGLSLAGNAVAALTGLAPEVQLTVTGSLDSVTGGTCDTCGHGDLVDGTYSYDGTEYAVRDMNWMSFAALPKRGDVVDVSRGPLWWHPIIERTDTAVFLLLYGLAPLLAGALLARATYLPRPRKTKTPSVA